MAQNACQQMSLAEFYMSLRALITKVYDSNQKLVRASEFLASMDAATATNMGIDTITRDVIADLRIAINESLDFYDGTATSRTKILKDQINKLRYI